MNMKTKPVCPSCGSGHISGQSTVHWEDGKWTNGKCVPWDKEYFCLAILEGKEGRECGLFDKPNYVPDDELADPMDRDTRERIEAMAMKRINAAEYDKLQGNLAETDIDALFYIIKHGHSETTDD